MTDLAAAAVWRPQLASEVVLGPPRWTGTAFVSDLARDGDERVITVGLAERLLIEMIDGRRGVPDIADELRAQGVKMAPAQLYAVLNKLTFYGLVKRPFLADAGAEPADSPPAVLDSVIGASRPSGGLLTVWRKLGFLAHPAAFSLAGVLGLTGLVALVWAWPGAARTMMASGWVAIAVALVLSVIWNVAVTLLHENAHAAVFHAVSGRRPFLALTRFGIVLMPNTHLPGLALVTPSAKARIVAIGPAISGALGLMPVALWFFSPAASWLHTVGAMSILLETVVLLLAISPFPNTDATRLIEAASSTDQVQAVAFRTLLGRNQLPASLPRGTKCAVRAYPILLALTLLAWGLAAAWVIWLVLA